MTERTLPADARMIPEQATCVFRGEIFDVYQWQQELFDGTFATYEMLRRPDTVVILAVDDDSMVVSIDETQPGGLTRSMALPMGRVDEDDVSVLGAAKRELREETGLEFANWKLLQVRQPEQKIEWFIHVFLAWKKTSQVEPIHDPGERIIVGKSSYETIRERYKVTIGILQDVEKIEDLLENVSY